MVSNRTPLTFSTPCTGLSKWIAAPAPATPGSGFETRPPVGLRRLAACRFLPVVLATLAAGGAAEAPASLTFQPFGAGLPTSGQWREGFRLADLNGDGQLDLVHGPARKQPGS